MPSIDGLNVDSHLIDEPSRTIFFEIKGGINDRQWAFTG